MSVISVKGSFSFPEKLLQHLIGSSTDFRSEIIKPLNKVLFLSSYLRTFTSSLERNTWLSKTDRHGHVGGCVGSE